MDEVDQQLTLWKAFMRDLDLPHDLEREHVHTVDHDYTLRGSETRALSIVGSFRAVPASDLRDTFGHALDPRQGWDVAEPIANTLLADGRSALSERRNPQLPRL